MYLQTQQHEVLVFLMCWLLALHGLVLINT